MNADNSVTARSASETRTDLGLGTAATTASTDYATASQGTKADNVGAVNGLVKSNGSASFSAAVSGTDYAPATSGTALLKGNGSGGFSAAVAGTDYLKTTLYVLASDQSITSSTTFTAMNNISGISLSAGKKYLMSGKFIWQNASATPGTKFQITSTGTMVIAGSWEYGTNTQTFNQITGTSFASSRSITTGSNHNWDIHEFLLQPSTSVTITIEFAQNTSSSDATVLKAGSFVRITEVP